MIGALAVLMAGPPVAGASASAKAANLRVDSRQLVDGPGAGRIVQLRGINRSGLEYACIQGWGFFDSPHPDRIDDRAMIAAMNSWDINVVRVPLNEDCWLGVNAPRRYSGAAYRKVVGAYVRALNASGLYVILDLHWASPGSRRATDLIPMADADHAPAFWRSVATTFKRNHAVLFDLFNEPFGIGWGCWRDGCDVHVAGSPVYRAAGMQRLVDAVRATGARQPLLLGGVDWSGDLSRWVAYEPRDPLHQLVASEHNYGGLSPCDGACRQAVRNVRRHAPVVFGELGETDCRHQYLDSMMRFADANRIGYLGWAWDAVEPGGWTCTGGPSLITDYKGTPTAFGVGLRDHFRALGEPYKPL